MCFVVSVAGVSILGLVKVQAVTSSLFEYCALRKLVWHKDNKCVCCPYKVGYMPPNYTPFCDHLAIMNSDLYTWYNTQYSLGHRYGERLSNVTERTVWKIVFI